jgi:4-hydroxyacetophenone monooxygenase
MGLSKRLDEQHVPSDLTLKEALAYADPNALRLTLYHLTRDPALAAMKTSGTPLWAGALYTYTLDEAHHDEIRERAFDWFREHWGEPLDPALFEPERIRETMELFGHGPLSDDEFRLGYEEAAFDDFPREVRWSKRPSSEVLAANPVVIVGAGISGIAAAVHLELLGLPYTIIERQPDLGGTWNFNAYPEVRVDSSSLIYQYKFEKRYPWPEFFSSGPETKKYLKHCADKYGVTENIQFNTHVTAAEWNDERACWQLTIAEHGAEPRQIEARFLISASGLFSTPKVPDIAGIETFRGPVIHTTDWRDDFELAGKRVAQIGTGASGAQLMPYLARYAEQVTVFQRTANWVLPMEGYRDNIPEPMHWALQHLPLYWHWFSYNMHYLNAQLEVLQEYDEGWVAKGGRINQRNDALADNMTAYVRERLKEKPELIDKVLPAYPPLARRPTVDNGWYDALLRDNVELVSEPIDHLTPDSIVTKDGRSYRADIIVSAAGFETTRYLWPATYRGRNGATLDQLWGKDGPRAHLGLTLPGFPNFFMFYGPSSQGRAGSFYSMAELWARYSLKAIVKVIEDGARAIEVREEAYEAFNRRLEKQNKKLIWERFGKGFYYLSKGGRSIVNTPWRGAEIHAMLYEPDFAEYDIR